MEKVTDVKVMRREGKNLVFIKTWDGTVPRVYKYEYDPQDRTALERRLNAIKAGIPDAT